VELKQTAEVIFCFESAAQAIMAEQALLEGAFDVRIMPVPSQIRAGCGFCLRFLPEDFGRAAAFLSGRGFPAAEAYRVELADGTGSYRRIFPEKGGTGAAGD
jgi:hypothetical protein